MIVRSNHLKYHPLSVALATTLMLTSGAVLAQDNSQASAQKAGNLDTVTVTGSRIKRVDVEGPAPVTVIGRDQIDREGFQTVGDMLQTLTQNTTQNYTGDLAVTGFTPNAQVVNLRNLGPGYTLTLINGRRPAQYPQPYNNANNVVNVRAIPTSMVERVEVLSGGASAIYGSDAVAGVVNIVLRKNVESHQIRAVAGTTEQGGGDTYKVEYSGGHTADRWSAMWAIQADQVDPIFGSQRKFMADERNNPWGRTANPSLSLVAIRVSDSPNGPVGHNAVYDAAACERFGYTSMTTARRGTFCGAYDHSASRSITNAQKNFSAYGHATFDITDNLQAFASATFYKSKAKASAGVEYWGTSGDRAMLTKVGSTTSAYFDNNLGHLVQLQRVFNAFELGGAEAATTHFDEKTYDVTLGLQGSFGESFDWDFYAQHSEYDYTANMPRLLAKPVHDYFLGEHQGWAGNFPIYSLNLDRWNSPITPDIYRSFATRVINQGKTASSSASFTLTGDLFELPAGSVGFAGVLEGVRQKVDLNSDPRTNQLRPLDNQTIYNLTSSGRTIGTRDRYAAGVEFRIPLLKSLTAQLAGRYDKYDDITAVDDAITYNVGLEWRPVDSLMLRGSYATSFKAPDMQLVYAQGAAAYQGILDEYACRSGTGVGKKDGPRTRAECNKTGDRTLYQAQALVAGNAKLKEEEGKSFTVGFVWDITDGMSLTADYYRIKLEDRATQLSLDYILRAEAACRLGSWSDSNPQPLTPEFCGNITSFVNRMSAPGTDLDGRVERINTAYINAALTDTSGIDATWRYRLNTDRIGTFTFDLGYTLMLTDKYQRFATDPLVDYRDDLGQAQRSRLRGSVSWRGEKWNATVFGTRFGSTGSYAGENGCHRAPDNGICYNRRLGAWSQFNATVGRTIGTNMAVQLDIVNLFNDMYRHDPSQPYPYYNAFIGADPRGRRYNLAFTYKF
ncbi:TonB-dependent receptor [Lysobacteraceae bacterium NML75-0749]|nr:TonB-dependent receptor [Xanthomonadaceae bacterium NML75-0749]PJK03956.1 TonB-dependent receptor [Xanthomonadaceae bacterium NML71-0210]PJK04160.1 TonB-dependent receptor [Xanthomonadaceae bacterium NML91-0268]